MIVAAGVDRRRWQGQGSFRRDRHPGVDLDPSSLADCAKAGVDRLVVWPRTATEPRSSARRSTASPSMPTFASFLTGQRAASTRSHRSASRPRREI